MQAWQLPASVTTGYMCCTSTTQLFQRIDCANLKPGDALVTRKMGHAILFHHFVNQSASNNDSATNQEFVVWEQAGTSLGTVERKWSFVGVPPTSPDCIVVQTLPNPFRTTLR